MLHLDPAPSPDAGPDAPADAEGAEACWARALFLHERETPAADALSPEQVAEAAGRAGAWRQAAGLDEDTFAARLASAGLTADGFARVLAAHRAGHPPTPSAGAGDGEGWREVLDEVRMGTHDAVALPPMTWHNPDGRVGGEPPFSSFIHPFLQVGMARLRAGVRAVEAKLPDGGALMEPAVESQLVRNLVERLVKLCSGTLILELNVARLREQLQGDTPAERFRYFSERHFTAPVRMELLREYALLARLLCLTTKRWAEVMVEFLARLAADRAGLGELLDGEGTRPFGTVRALRMGLSDPHRGGRGVVIAEDVHGRRVVYKPVSLAADHAMGRLVRAVEGLGLRHAHRTVRVADRGDYGWLEHLEMSACQSPEALGRFYWRQGSLIALLHLVRGADFHHENLLACGEQPVLVDHEALFHQAPPGAAEPSTAVEEANAVMRASVLRQALLPFVHRFTPEARGIDASGLGGAGGQVAEGAVRRWADPATDRMRVVAADLVTEEAKNLPSLRGAPVEPLDHLGDIVRGFVETYDAVARHKEAVRPLLDAFTGATVRHLVRPTRQYTTYFRESNHPNDLRDGLERDALLDRLWAQAAVHPRYRAVAAAEAEDLRTGDIPAFYARPESADLWDARGGRIEGFFPATALDEAHRHLDALGPADRDRQVLLIRLAISEGRSAARAPEPFVEAPTLPPAVRSTEAEADAETDALLDAALRIGDELRARAIVGAHGASWIGVDPFGEDGPGGARPRNVTLAHGDLYHGTAGIALFLAHLGAATGRGEATELARGAVRSLRQGMEHTGPHANGAVGAYLGRASYAYALLHLAALWNEPALLDAALADVPRVEALVTEDAEFDLLAGSAGCALVMLRLHRATWDAAALRAARAAGDHLLRSARPAHGGLGWAGATFGAPVPGLSHGAAGIAWALLELADATGDGRYRDAASRALAFERGMLAAPEGEPFRGKARWCHGPAGIALGRIASAALLDGAEERAEIAAGARCVVAAGPPADPGLCHGVLGSAAILSAAGRRLGVAEWEGTARAWALGVAAGVARGGGGGYLPLHARFAGLMCGLAGTGYGLLRFARPDAVPCVLTLAPAPAVPGRAVR
ncbi:MAG: Lanthionine biosynthesis protein LanM [Gemmatimonadetes bacterium]|nr:Lanthionine biosynthesis protein LanM [Gemmatimonadota bacterium]